MTQPLDVIMAFHNAFRGDMETIDTAALEAARGKAGLAATIERYRFFNEILIWHATGEEKEIYPVLESVAPLVAEAYVMDHHGLDAAGEGLHAAVSSGDALQTARAAAVVRRRHLHREADARTRRAARQADRWC